MPFLSIVSHGNVSHSEGSPCDKCDKIRDSQKQAYIEFLADPKRQTETEPEAYTSLLWRRKDGIKQEELNWKKGSIQHKGETWKGRKYLVIAPEWGNSETVMLDEIEWTYPSVESLYY